MFHGTLGIFDFRLLFLTLFLFCFIVPFVLKFQEDKEELEAGRQAIEGGEDIPPQMLFCHQGQRDIKEIHFHPQIPGLIVSTAADGFNVWRPCNL